MYQRALGCTVAPAEGGQPSGSGSSAASNGALADAPDKSAGVSPGTAEATGGLGVATDGIDDAGIPWNESEV